jgi:hypothetical protein
VPTWNSMSAFVDDLTKTLSPAEIRKITRAQAEAAQSIANRHASRDLGSDRAFSGWTRANRVQLDTQIRRVRGDAHLLTPTRSSAGPWTVAEQGRNQGNASGFAGPGINTRTGITSRTKSGAIRKVRSRRARRWNGTTQGKRTATDATTEMTRELPKIADIGVRLALRKRFDVT